ncbi:leucine-rich repeat domain-containing protein [Pseudomonas moraviensis]|uniref:leucine-rich repeat domain-containing protein n=1 Tax=Pseudomonas moraviensis TaxID=321662 RepID=UPI001059E70E|nr:leucine-rich repeat domain-containing protein [Pseudomonas moraviensis]TDK55113.1 leucine-rich repeat domain-containing protein [Pseudomonas moraviensis]
MPLKPPRSGGTRSDADVHTSTNRSSNKDFSQADIPGRDGTAPWVHVDDPKLRSISPGDGAGRETVLPTPVIEVHPTPLSVAPPVKHRPLERYRIKSAAELPDADGEGVRVHKNRQYVELADGGLVLVGVDPDTGLYRARLSSELLPSGPWMLRDIDSGIWHPHSDFNARTNPLTEASLQAFRAGLDVRGAEPGSDGVIHRDGKLYVVIREQAYQVMQDLDASRPEYKVWRLVRPQDPVATDSANIYRSSRSGETLAITLNERNTWVSILTGLRGGMDGNDPARSNPFSFHRPWLASAVPSGGQAPVVTATTRAQVKRYFADATDQHADDFIARFGESAVAEAELKRLQLEFPQLNREITAWESGYKGKHDAERSRRLAVGATMRRLYKWQGESSEKVYRDGRLIGFRLDLDLSVRGNFALPAFSIPLRSVVSLSMEGSPSRSLENLFSMFAHIESFEVRRFRGKSNELLAEISKLPALRVLVMQEIKLWQTSPQSEHFTRLAGLQELSLMNCSIWPRLSVRGMSELRVLRARSCDLLHLPVGLGDMPAASRLQVLDLCHNPLLTDAPDATHMSELRELNLSWTRISAPPLGFGLPGGPSRLEILDLSLSPLAVAPSLRGMTALQDVDLSQTHIRSFPEGVTSEIPKSRLSLAYTGVTSIPETVELRKGFDLSHALISDPVSFRRLIAARRQTGTDFWLGRHTHDLVIEHWMHNVPQAQRSAKIALWSWLTSQPNIEMMTKIRDLVRTPEFQVERALLQRRVWSFLEHFRKASLGEQEVLRDIALAERSPGKMLDRLEEEIRKFDSTWQNQPAHHLSKRPRLD